ncbi:hypothetical protein AJ80_05427 [Polytolypa hystricis UAMH7299]|uniref:FAD dependent oxidoreductase domain-containing protein n=1 Tax=Polytolypa hystricis (strain UAMH7299) TaxID=1447883 RepID=A0A2B7Y3J5_POLH7|nr:hypothetical protein AJ80_05427 [Polytolypa hystricis UAMH7299]
MASAGDHYLIVGAGVFGAATALELRKRVPNSNVTLLDSSPFPNPNSASSDLNKIIRADYGDVFYMKLALDAQELWRNDPIYKPYYHESGMLYAESKGMAQDFLQNYKSINVTPASEVFTAKEAKLRWGGVFRDAFWEGVSHTYFNPRSGWGDGDGALRSLIQAAIDQGATYQQAPVSTLIIDGADASCRGVRLEDGRELNADHVIVATGAWTSKFLADSAPDNKAIHADGRIIAAGAIQCSASFPADQAEKLKGAPVIFNAMKHTEGESIPPTADRRLKFNYERSFTNYEPHKSGQEISVPPSQNPDTAWNQDVPQGLKDEIHTVVKHTYGDWIQGLKIENYRMCWDAVTPNQDWIIAPHPHCQKLYIASGGSFHSWKFMPTIGQYVVQMLLKELGPKETTRWAWDRDDAGGALPEYLPSRDLKEIPGYSKS